MRHGALRRRFGPCGVLLDDLLGDLLQAVMDGADKWHSMRDLVSNYLSRADWVIILPILLHLHLVELGFMA